MVSIDFQQIYRTPAVFPEKSQNIRLSYVLAHVNALNENYRPELSYIFHFLAIYLNMAMGALKILNYANHFYLSVQLKQTKRKKAFLHLKQL
jgi:hypothetical protein